MQLHDRLLPAPCLAAREAAPLGLRLHPCRTDTLHAHAEDLLDGLPDLRLVRVRVDTAGALVGREPCVALLGDRRADEDLARRHERPLCVMTSSAAGESTRRSAPITSATPTESAGSTDTCAM